MSVAARRFFSYFFPFFFIVYSFVFFHLIAQIMEKPKQFLVMMSKWHVGNATIRIYIVFPMHSAITVFGVNSVHWLKRKIAFGWKLQYYTNKYSSFFSRGTCLWAFITFWPPKDLRFSLCGFIAHNFIEFT